MISHSIGIVINFLNNKCLLKASFSIFLHMILNWILALTLSVRIGKWFLVKYLVNNSRDASETKKILERYPWTEKAQNNK